MIKRRCLLGPWQLHQLLLWQLGMVGRLSLHSHLLGFWDYAWMRFWLVLLCSSVGFIGFKLPEVISSKATLFTSTKNRSEDLTPRSRSTAVQVGEIMRIYISQMLDIWYKKKAFSTWKKFKSQHEVGTRATTSARQSQLPTMELEIELVWSGWFACQVWHFAQRSLVLPLRWLVVPHLLDRQIQQAEWKGDRKAWRRPTKGCHGSVLKVKPCVWLCYMEMMAFQKESPCQWIIFRWSMLNFRGVTLESEVCVLLNHFLG